MRRTVLIPAILLAVVAVGCDQELPVDIPGLGGQKMSDEEQIAAVLNDVQQGFESQRIYKVLAHLSRDYRDETGQDYEAVRNFLTDRMKKYREIRITRTRPKILVQGDTARALETFGAVGKPINPVDTPALNLQGQIAVYLEHVGNEWLITGWESVG